MKRLISAALAAFALVSAQAATQDIAVTAAGDVVSYRSWCRGCGSYSWSDASAKPNTVSHSYYDGSGDTSQTSLTFDLSSILDIPVADVTSVTLYYNVLSMSGGDNVGNLDNVGPVLQSNGTGWKFFDVTTPVKGLLDVDSPTAGFHFSFTGYSGFAFSSAEGGDPAFLRIQTTGVVPEPETYALMLAGLAVTGLTVRRRAIL